MDDNSNRVYDDEDLQRLYNENYFSERSRPPLWQRRAEFIVKKFNPKTALDVFTNTFEEWKKIFEKQNFSVSKFSPHEMMALRGRLGKFKFYKFPNSMQNMIKRVAYDYANKKMNDTSFLLHKKN